jgi:hypothetical protein
MSWEAADEQGGAATTSQQLIIFYYTADEVFHENIDRSVIDAILSYSIEDCVPLTREFPITATHTLQLKIIYGIIIMMPYII